MNSKIITLWYTLFLVLIDIILSLFLTFIYQLKLNKNWEPQGKDQNDSLKKPNNTIGSSKVEENCNHLCSLLFYYLVNIEKLMTICLL